jgi:bacteriocin-like protein
MPDNKKSPAKESKKEKPVEKLTNKELDKVSGGANGWPCPPDGLPCEPAICAPIPCLPHKLK